MKSSQGALPASAYVLLGSLALFWGVNWTALKVVLAEMGPWHFRAWCLGGGAAGLFVIAALGGHSLRIPRGSWCAITVISLFNMVAWNVFVAFGVPLMDSGRAVVVAYTFPAWGVLFGAWIAREPLTGRALLGMALGLGAVALLLGRELEAVGRSPAGTLLLLGAAIGWAIGTALMKRWPMAMPVSSYTAWQLAIGFVPIFLVALVRDPGGFSPVALSRPALAAFIYTVVICFMYCYWAWMKVATVVPVSVSSIGVLLVPIVGVFSGMILLGERPHWSDYAALALVVAALATLMLPAAAARAVAAREGLPPAGAVER